jgi:hypothetical protein
MIAHGHSSLGFGVIAVTVGKPPRAGFWATTWATRNPAPEVEKAEASSREVGGQSGSEEGKCSGMAVPDPAMLRHAEGHRKLHIQQLYSRAQFKADNRRSICPN